MEVALFSSVLTRCRKMDGVSSLSVCVSVSVYEYIFRPYSPLLFYTYSIYKSQKRPSNQRVCVSVQVYKF